MTFLNELKSIPSGKKDLRKFGITMAVVLGGLGALLLWKGRPTYPIFLSLAAVFLLAGLTIPNFLKPIHKAWMALALLMGWIMTRVILSILFFLIFTPIGLLSRLLGKKLLDADFSEKKESYWISRTTKFDQKHYDVQY